MRKIIMIFALMIVMLSAMAQEKTYDYRYERKTVFIEQNFPINSQVILKTMVEKIVHRDSIQYLYCMKHGPVVTKFTLQDIKDLLSAIRELSYGEKSGEYNADNGFVLGMNKYTDRTDWYVVINSEKSRRFYFIESIVDFKEQMVSGALVLMDYYYANQK
jgi:hypothetical protein